MSEANAPANRFFSERKVLCNPKRRLFIPDRFCTQPFDEVTRVDADRAGCGTKSVRRAGLDASVGEIVY